MYETTIVHFAEVARDKAAAMRRAPFGFFVGAMMAGAYVGIAMILALSCAAGLSAGVRPLVLGAVFGVGLILTVFARAKLFTGYAAASSSPAATSLRPAPTREANIATTPATCPAAFGPRPRRRPNRSDPVGSVGRRHVRSR